ncbi:ABC transporter permease [Cryptosporangium japonicum]|uniref:Autoinducer 2 import system permease protein LsrC n=1 Tax=Cryptosporangium japonicum TaxID=80872 RepID=A0ABN0TIQ5_9ACTN
MTTLTATRRSVPYFVPAVLAVVLMIVITALKAPQFLDGGWKLVFVYASPLILLGMAQAPVVLSGGGGMDLSVGPAAGLISVILAAVLIPAQLSVWWLIVLAALLLGAAGGAINGALVAFVRIPPIIATLATYLVFAGLATQILAAPTGFLPRWMRWFTGTDGPLPNVAYVVLGVGLVWWALTRTAYWRNLRAVGSNDRAAYASGVPVTAVRFLAYLVTGVFTGVAGLVLTAVLGGADSTVGPTYTLQAIAAVALGGISLAGGRGGLLGAAAGAVLLFLIQNYLTLTQASSFVLQMVYGVVLILAIVANGLWDRRRKAR